ncbi:MAG: efflux RND transporter periplasmic adaptor subunit [Usitatibacter sp.]
MSTTLPTFKHRRRWPWIVAILVLGAAVGIWWYFGSTKSQEAAAARRPAGAVPVITAKSESRDIPVKLKSNGTVTAVQSVDLRAQITSTVKEVHIREGQNVQKGDLLFTLDSGTEEANLRKALAQVEKDKADLSTAVRNLVRQRDLFEQKFISQAALDVVQNQVDTLNGQLAIDTAAIEAARVALGYTVIRAPFAGRTGTIGVRAGSLVQASNTVTTAPLVTVTQIDPITVAFTLPEKELGGLQKALAAGSVTVTAAPPTGGEPFKGKVVFVDNAVDTTTGTIRVKAEFANPKSQLWPGAYVNVEVAPRTIANATVVPAQAVQTGPEARFIYVVGEDKTIVSRPVTLDYVEEGFAVVTGIKPGERVVVEGAQNVRPGSAVAEADRSSPDETKTGKREGKKKGA